MLRRYVIYAAIAIVAAMVGATATHFYSKKIINALQYEIDEERNASLRSIKDSKMGIDTLSAIVDSTKSKNSILQQQVAAERARRKSLQDKSVVIKPSQIGIDSQIIYFRNMLNDTSYLKNNF